MLGDITTMADTLTECQREDTHILADMNGIVADALLELESVSEYRRIQ